MSDSDASDDEQQSVQPSVFYSRYATIEAPVLQQIAAPPASAAHATASASAVAGPRHSEHRCCLFNTAELVYQKRWTGADGCDIVLQPFAKHSANSDAAVALFKSTLAEVPIRIPPRSIPHPPDARTLACVNSTLKDHAFIFDKLAGLIRWASTPTWPRPRRIVSW